MTDKFDNPDEIRIILPDSKQIRDGFGTIEERLYIPGISYWEMTKKLREIGESEEG